MIQSKEDYLYYLEQDRRALRMKRNTPRIVGDEIWKFQRLMRKREYLENQIGGGILLKIRRILFKYLYNRMSIRLGLSIPINVFGPGLSIAHYGTIVVNGNAKVGKNCRIHEGVTIGATNGSPKAATIGDNVFIGSGAKIIGDVTISSNVAIGAGAVVVKDVISEHGCTVGGVPAKVISNNTSESNIRIL